MARTTRPGPVTAIAILDIVGGSLWLAGYLCGGLCVLFMFWAFANIPPQDANKPEIQLVKELIPAYMDIFNRNIPFFTAYVVGSLVISIIISIVVLAKGIGLLSMKPWARQVSIVYGVVQALVLLIGLVYNLAVMQPNMPKVEEDLKKWLAAQPNIPPEVAKAMREQKHQADNPGQTILNTVSSLFGLLVGLVYPIAVLIVMLQPSVKRAFAGGGGNEHFDSLDRAAEGEDDFGYRRSDDEEEGY